MSYLLDANIFIQAKNLHYGFDFCPAFWDWLTKQNQEGKVFSIEQVKNEINAGNDELSDWVNNQDDNFFLKPNNQMAQAFPIVSKWATSQDYENAAVNEFLQVADYYLVCYGLGHSMTIVTHEVASNSKKRIKIPNACQGLGINFMTPYTMLRNEQARFILGSV